MESEAPEVSSKDDHTAKLQEDASAAGGPVALPTIPSASDRTPPVLTEQPSDADAEMGGEAPCQLPRWWDEGS